MNKVGLIVSVALIGMLSIGNSAYAASALAWSPSTNATAHANGFDNVTAASIAAIIECNAHANGADDCYVVQSTSRGCIALATGDTKAAWSDPWTTYRGAVNEALEICNKVTDNCIWREYACN